MSNDPTRSLAERWSGDYFAAAVRLEELERLWRNVIRDERDSCGWDMDDHCDIDCTCGYDRLVAALTAKDPDA